MKIVATVIGGGFVGLHEAVLYALRGYKVYIIDINEDVVKRINSGNPEELHVREDYVVRNWYKVRSLIEATTSYSVVKEANVVILAVNTPLKVYGDKLIEGLMKGEDLEYFIDFTPLRRAVEGIVKYVQPHTYVNSLVTLHPGGTKELIIKPLLEEKGFMLGKDLYITYTPHRVDPGSRISPEQIPRIMGYYDKASLEHGLRVYRERLGLTIIPAKLELAELAKLHENAFRLVNIAFTQASVKSLCDSILEVIKLASTKPFGFMKFYPSPYAGGTCLVKDSIMYWYATRNELVKQALIINEYSPRIYAEIIAKWAKKRRLRRIVFYGLGYKPGTSYYASRELNPVERLIDEIKKIDPTIEIIRFDPEIPEKSDIGKDLMKDSTSALVVWGYKEILEGKCEKDG